MGHCETISISFYSYELIPQGHTSEMGSEAETKDERKDLGESVVVISNSS